MAASVAIVDAEMIDGLRAAVKDCAERGLHQASKWAAELLAATPAQKRRTTTSAPPPVLSSTPARPSQLSAPTGPSDPISMPPPSTIPHHPHDPLTTFGCRAASLHSEIPQDEADILAEGMACFYAREFPRAAHILKSCSSGRGRFMLVYSQYLASEKKAIQNWNKLDGTRRQPVTPVNVSLSELYESATKFEMTEDPWMLFLRGLLLRKLGRRAEAMELVILSLDLYVWNWSAWCLLSDMIHDADELGSLLPLIPITPTHPIVQLFQIRTLNTLHQPTENELGLCERLIGTDYFPNSLWIMSLRAAVLYHLHDFAQAEVQFQKILEIDPFRVDDIDIYSNILYVTENKLKLSKLAHDFLAIDKDRPEVCCLVGNHYSLRAEHEKAIKYFRRATDLDKTYLSAWTLMGHEYVEMKNSHAAIEAYRRAVDINRKDYRAWYGLGQAYELLNMHQYALYYYQRATALRPYDVRLWQAQGASYEEMGRLREAIDCFKRALLGADVNEVSINVKLAKLHDDLGEYPEAASYHGRIIDVSRVLVKPIAEYARSAVYVSRYHLEKGGGDLGLAMDYMEKVAASNSEDADQAADLLKRIRSEILSRSSSLANGTQLADSGNAETIVYVS
ncbi:TPR-like protein [Amylostereum chailletii]|nr:TPR-like protein [Amylostereum chailletii]